MRHFGYFVTGVERAREQYVPYFRKDARMIDEIWHRASPIRPITGSILVALGVFAALPPAYWRRCRRSCRRQRRGRTSMVRSSWRRSRRIGWRGSMVMCRIGG
ncbi:MAG: hypothetical protein U0841_22210 [Chloroflexia bacterium]